MEVCEIKKIKSNFIDNNVSYIYEDVCREKMWELNDERINCRFDKIGRWWDTNHEIDIVGLNSDGNEIIFGECIYVFLSFYIVAYSFIQKK